MVSGTAISPFSQNQGNLTMPAKPDRPRLEVENNGDVTIVTFSDRKVLDADRIQVIGDQFSSLLDQSDRTRFLLDFQNVEYMSSATLGMLMMLKKKVQAKKGQMVLCNISPEIKEIFEITGLDKAFLICPSEQEGLRAFK